MLHAPIINDEGIALVKLQAAAKCGGKCVVMRGGAICGQPIDLCKNGPSFGAAGGYDGAAGLTHGRSTMNVDLKFPATCGHGWANLGPACTRCNSELSNERGIYFLDNDPNHGLWVFEPGVSCARPSPLCVRDPHLCACARPRRSPTGRRTRTAQCAGG